jgi:hypothetical protein
VGGCGRDPERLDDVAIADLALPFHEAPDLHRPVRHEVIIS